MLLPKRILLNFNIIELSDVDVSPVEDILGSLLIRVRWLHSSRTQHVVDRLRCKHFILPPFSDFIQKIVCNMGRYRFIGVFNLRKFESQSAVFSRQIAIFLGVGFDLNNLGHLLLVNHSVAVHVVHSAEGEWVNQGCNKSSSSSIIIFS